MELTQGTRFERYAIEAEVGSGGMGWVYRAMDTRLHRRVALKVLHPGKDDASSWADSAARMLREARAAAALDHPNVVAVYDVGEHEGMPYIAMEYVQGATLRSASARPEATFARKLRWLIDVAEALGAAHEAGLVHRDIKPDNVLVRDDGVVKVVDFGIARQAKVQADAETAAAQGELATLTAKGAMVGTLLYMSPEQAQGEPVDARSDQFSWGVMAYELLAGRLPWSKADSVGVILEILSQTPASLSKTCAEVPVEVGEIVARCLEKAPGDRFESMREVAGLLGPWANGTAAAVTTGVRPSRRASKRWQMPVVVGAVLVVLGTAGWALRGKMHGAAAAAPSVSASASATAITMLDLPAPKSSNAEAIKAYQDAMRALRDANWWLAERQLDRARQLDPDMPEAQLRTAIVVCMVDPGRRADILAAYAKAARERDRLSPRDRDFLGAWEPVSGRESVDPSAAAKRLRDLAERRPNDAEVLALAAWFGNSTSSLRHAEAMQMAERAAALDPGYAGAWQALAHLRFSAGDEAGASLALEKCHEGSPTAAECYWEQALEAGFRGECGRVEEYTRAGLVLDPGHRELLWLRASSLRALGRPTEATEPIWQRWQAACDPSVREAETMRLRINLALLDGRFDDALQQSTRRLQSLGANASAAMRAPFAEIGIARETGRAADGAVAARQFLDGRDAWTASAIWLLDGGPPAVAALRDAGRATDADVVRERERFENAWKSSIGRPWVWAFEYGTTVRTKEQARHALDSMPAGWDPHAFPLSYLRSQAWIGRLFLLSGEPARAVPWLQGAARLCDVVDDPLLLTWAQAWLGEALEQTGDTKGACEAYAVVLKRWGKATPRSITADAVRKRVRALTCEH